MKPAPTGQAIRTQRDLDRAKEELAAVKREIANRRVGLRSFHDKLTAQINEAQQTPYDVDTSDFIVQSPSGPAYWMSDVLYAVQNKVDSLPINVLDEPYKADNTGATDVTSTIQSAITDAAAQGRRVVGSGTFRIDGTIDLPSNTNIDMPEAVFTAVNAPQNQKQFQALGTEGTAVNLTGDAAAGATTLSVAAGAESAFTVGGYVKVGSSKVWDTTTNLLEGEIGVVASTASGSVVLRSPLDRPYATADTAFVAPLMMLENISVRLRRLIGGGSDLRHVGFNLDRCVNVRIDCIRFTNVHNTAVQIFDCIDARVRSIHVTGSNYSSTGYGVSFNNACQGGGVYSSYFRDCRHATTVGGSTSRKGIARRISFNFNDVEDTSDVGMDVHAAGDQIQFIGNTVKDSGNNGISVACPSATITGNLVVRSQQHGIQVRNYSDQQGHYTVTGNRVLAPTSIGIGLYTSGNTHGTLFGEYVITNNSVEDPGSHGIQCASLDTFRFDSLVLMGNVVRNQGAAGYGINVQKCDRATIIGNQIHDAPATQTAMYVNDVQESVVSENIVRFASLSTGTGILVASGVDVAVSGNVVKLGGTGLRFDNSSSNCTAFGNNLRGCTTPLTMGTGTGHISSTADAAGAYNRT